MINLAIIDDHPSIIEGLKTMFGNDPNFSLTGIFSNGKSALEQLPKSEADILLLDINLPDMSGTEVCKKLKEMMPELGIIAFTSFKDTKFLRNMVNSGAKGFILKNSSYDEIHEAILEVYQNREYIQPEMKEALVNETLSLKTTSDYIPKLTRREKEILTLILDELTTHEIADKLFISFKTVETHRLNLLQKLNVKNTAGMVKKALERGLVD